MIQLTTEPIDEAQVLAQVRSPRAGAIILFAGITREFTGERQTVDLHYDSYPPLAEKQLADLEAQARQRWPLVECVIVHRVGRVPLAETSVAIAVSSPHRAAAFEAGQWLIDTLKQVVAIWKQEHYADGSTEWVHPPAN